LHERRNANFHLEGVLAFVIGVVCTIGIMYILVFPALDRTSAAQLDDMQLRLSQMEQAYDDLLEEKELEISGLDDQIFRLEASVNEWAARFDASERTFSILNAFELLRENRMREAADAIGGVDIDGLPQDIAERANEVRDVAYPYLARQYFSEGFTAYNARDFEKARVDFERAYRYAQHLDDDPFFGDVLYYIGWTYSQLDLFDQAIFYLERVIEEFPNHRYVTHARNRINAIS
jgi:tetratricopeptide (TPR) repeat protein